MNPVGVLRLRDPSGRSAQDDYWGFLQEAQIRVNQNTVANQTVVSMWAGSGEKVGVNAFV